MHDLLGLYDDTTAQYLISLAKDSKSYTDLADKLVKEDLLPDTIKARDFISDLYSRYSIPATGPSDY